MADRLELFLTGCLAEPQSQFSKLSIHLWPACRFIEHFDALGRFLGLENRTARYFTGSYQLPTVSAKVVIEKGNHFQCLRGIWSNDWNSRLAKKSQNPPIATGDRPERTIVKNLTGLAVIVIHTMLPNIVRG